MNPYHLYAAAFIVGAALVLASANVSAAIDRYRVSWQPPSDPLEGMHLHEPDLSFDVIEDPDDVLPFRGRAA